MPDVTQTTDAQTYQAGVKTPRADAPRADKPIRIGCGSFAKLPFAGYRHRLQPARFENLGVDVRMAEVDNPYYTRAHKSDREDPTNPRRVTAARNSNESPLVRLEALGSLDPKQARAGHTFRMLYERVAAGQASPSFIQERVDGGSAPDAFSEGRARASRQLRGIAEQMTAGDYDVLRFVCGDGRSLREFDRARSLRKGSGKSVLLAALDRLVTILGLDNRRTGDG